MMRRPQMTKSLSLRYVRCISWPAVCLENGMAHVKSQLDIFILQFLVIKQRGYSMLTSGLPSDSQDSSFPLFSDFVLS